MGVSVWVWVGFIVLVLSLVMLDLGVFHRKAHAMTYREALGWTAVWVSVAMIFNVAVYFLYSWGYVVHSEGLTGHRAGQDAAIDFFLGYVIEESLSIDNIFVIAMIITYFRIPLSQQHRVLYWGILGAVVLRGVMIVLGVALVKQFIWVNYIFGALLLFSAYKMAFSHADEEVDVEHSWLMRWTRKFIRTTKEFDGGNFFIVRDGVRYATPMFMALVLVESSDVMFAVDSIPAVFAITKDPFIVFTSNIFAILGLRSLYFVLAGLMDQFRYLKMALVVLLAFIGAKIIIETYDHAYELPHFVSLAVIVLVLGTGVGASMFADRRDAKREAARKLEGGSSEPADGESPHVVHPHATLDDPFDSDSNGPQGLNDSDDAKSK